MSIHKINRDGVGVTGAEREYGTTGSVGNLSQDADDLAALGIQKTTSLSSIPTEQSNMTRDEQMEYHLAILNSNTASEETKRRSLIKLGRFYSFDVWKHAQICGDLSYLEQQKKRYEEMLEEHQRASPAAMEFARNFVRKNR